MSKNLNMIASLKNAAFALVLLGGPGVLFVQAKAVCESTNQQDAVACGDNVAGHALSPSEVKALMKRASLPGDHWQLAEHFREEAAQEDETAAWYESTAACAEPKSHCSSVANSARKASKHAMKMAEEEDRIAQAMLNNAAGGIIHGR
jgi:hypothetical protein